MGCQVSKGEIKFIYSEMATKFCEISTLLLTSVHTVKNKVEISQNFVAFSEYMNFISPLETWQPIFLATKKSLMFFRMRFPQCIRYWILVKVFFQKVSDKNFRSYLNKHLSYSSCTISAQSELQLHCQNWDDNLMNCLLFSIWVPLPQYLQYTCN